MNTQTLSYATPTTSGIDNVRPWIPNQLMAASLVFGPAAAGVAAGVNFARLGKKSRLVPCIVIGLLLFLAEAALVVFAIPGDGARPVGLMLNVLIGAGFMLSQKGTFQAWIATHWRPTTPEQKYRPGHIGQMFLIGLGCLVFECGIILLMMIAGGQLK